MMSIDDDIITEIIKREGPATNDPLDGGGRTQFGISEKANPAAWADGKVTEAEARAIYMERYIMATGLEQITDSKLKSLLVDWAVTSGPAIPIKALQEMVGVTPDGIMGPATVAALARTHMDDVVNGCVAKRIQMIGRIVTKNPSQIKYLNGWLNRAVEWLG